MSDTATAQNAIAAFLGRPATAAELAIYADQVIRLEPGIFNNPILPRVNIDKDNQGIAWVDTSLVKTPLVPTYRGQPK